MRTAAVGRTRTVATARKVAPAAQNLKAVNVRTARNLNGVSPGSKGAINKLKRTNLNRNAVLNMLRNSANANELSNLLGRGNDNRGNNSNGGNGNFLDNFGRGGRNNDLNDLSFNRRNNNNSADSLRNLALGLDLRNFGSNGGNSYGGRNFNNSNRF